VGNLPYAVGWQDLKDLFRGAGNPVRADVSTDYQGRSKGFGTITMGSVEEARKAVCKFFVVWFL
jgi:RNA recognition motif-containing protein